MKEPVLAYAWFKRPYRKAPGNWTPVPPEGVLQFYKHYREKKKIKTFPVGEVLRAGTLGTWYEFICVAIPVPPEVYDGIEEV